MSLNEIIGYKLQVYKYTGTNMPNRIPETIAMFPLKVVNLT